jgi:hypothetical protein
MVDQIRAAPCSQLLLPTVKNSLLCHKRNREVVVHKIGRVISAVFRSVVVPSNASVCGLSGLAPPKFDRCCGAS